MFRLVSRRVLGVHHHLRAAHLKSISSLSKTNAYHERSTIASRYINPQRSISANRSTTNQLQQQSADQSNEVVKKEEEDKTSNVEEEELVLSKLGSQELVNNLFTIEDLMEARVHLGHKEGMLNSHMRPYIFGKRLGVLIFDLEQTAHLLNKALLIAAEIAYRNGIILFVHHSRQSGYLVEDAARDCGEYAHCRRWRDDVFTNSQSIFQAVTRLPDLVIFMSVLERVNELHKAVIMSAKMLIPTIGICDTNASPTLITYPVPGNDDSPQSIELYCRLFKTAILNGKAKRKEIIDKYGEEFYNKTLETR